MPGGPLAPSPQGLDRVQLSSYGQPPPLMPCPCSRGQASSSTHPLNTVSLPLCPALHSWLPGRFTERDLAQPGYCLCSTLISQVSRGTDALLCNTRYSIPPSRVLGKLAHSAHGKHLACGTCPVGASCCPSLGPPGQINGGCRVCVGLLGWDKF